MILVPVKTLSNAKQRLASVLDQASRVELAHAMLSDVLETLGTWPNRPEVAVVTSDSFALDLARHFDFEVIADEVNRSETDAIEMATLACEARGVESTLVIPGDIPLMRTWEIATILRLAPGEGSVLVPAADGRGTNAVWRSPAGLFPLRFGNDSFKPHLAAAKATQKPCVVLPLPGIALDIDNPEDLRQLAAKPGETRAQRLVRQWDLNDLPRAANE
ncbi:MAG TPA: 2-phospho-L-lactate guanylyltransferase [Candidatus Eisenbacteria bacterium]|jgi:2-phospho-L-lactate guanylyltransferase|nr:2-phospho-L-lactate guanylyltransferase [Candidatus Eisenbacteria bacterium]